MSTTPQGLNYSSEERKASRTENNAPRRPGVKPQPNGGACGEAAGFSTTHEIYFHTPESTPEDTQADTEDTRLKTRLLRANRYRFLAEARDILFKAGIAKGLVYPANFHRTAKCLYFAHTDVSVLRDSHKRAHYKGVFRCGSTWSCPLCNATLQVRRRAEIAKFIEYTYTKGSKCIMLTFTFSHTMEDKLKDLMKNFAAALMQLRGGRQWVKFKAAVEYIGLIRSLEVLHGENGWHLHCHEVWGVAASADIEVIKKSVVEKWLSACSAKGLIDIEDRRKLEGFMRHAVDVKDNVSSADYLAKMDDQAKWGIEQEMTIAESKTESAGRHPFALLDITKQGPRDRELFLEYSMAMKGRAQIFWSHGLKKMVGVDDKTDEELIEEVVETAEVIAQLNTEQWQIVLKKKAQSTILDIAEKEGFAGIKEWFLAYNQILKDPEDENHEDIQRIYLSEL